MENVKNFIDAAQIALNSAVNTDPALYEHAESSRSNVADAITSLGQTLNNAIEQLTTALSSHLTSVDHLSISKIAFGILITIIGAFSAYLFNLFHWKMVERKKRLSGIGTTLSSLINELESIAVAYWISDYNANEHQEIQATEISIKSKMRLIVKYVRILAPQLNTKKTILTKKKIEDFSDEIFDLVTGDGFESISKKPSKQKAIKISNECSDMKALLSCLDI